jgi:hypothetical protein
MVQTLDDMLSDHQASTERLAIWLRIGRELPLNIVEEHINNLEEINMSKLLKSSNKRSAIIISAAVIIVLGVSLSLRLRHNEPYSPTTFARLQHVSSKPVCTQKSANAGLKVNSKDDAYIGNVIATSITDALAGTNVDVYFKTYDSSTATGTATYGSYYGSYNYTVKNVDPNNGNAYVGGWRVIRFQPCNM